MQRLSGRWNDLPGHYHSFLAKIDQYYKNKEKDEALKLL
jgi:hypothetical protein